MSIRLFRQISAAAFAAVLVASCATADDDDSATSDTSVAADDSRGDVSAPGVTADSIKIGFAYIDLQTLAESGIIRVDHGPYEEIIRALVDDVNANGGINGRNVELVTAKYSPIGNTDQLAACTKLTEDDKVFAVLNGLLNENNLCITQQHSTVLVSTSGLTADRLARVRAPWATSLASAERAVEALVRALDENDQLEGSTIGVYAAQGGNEQLIDVAVDALDAAGYEVADAAFNDAPEGDVQAATAQNTVIAQRMKDAGVDTVINVGLFIPGADFDATDFHPRMYSLEAGNVAAAAFTNPLGKFPFVGGLGATASSQEVYDDPEFQRCKDVYETATGETIKTEVQEDLDGKSSGFVAMSIACTTLQIFVAAAEEAGENLTNDSFRNGLESLATIDLASVPVASFGPDKADGQDAFQLLQFDANWKAGEGKPQFEAVGEAVTLDN